MSKIIQFLKKPRNWRIIIVFFVLSIIFDIIAILTDNSIFFSTNIFDFIIYTSYLVCYFIVVEELFFPKDD